MHRGSPARSLITAATLLICGAAPFAVPSPDGTARAAAPRAAATPNASDVTANLWGWNWNSVAKALVGGRAVAARRFQRLRHRRDCSDGWQCITQSTGVKGMVGWHNATASATAVSNFTATAGDVIGFSRGAKGWVGLNASSGASTATYTTGLPDGVYCDVITGGAKADGCNGTAVTVSGGTTAVTIPAGGAVAIDVGATAG
ncbi:alpha amylase C-terminal domain-containing protein [Actinomadura sp. NTSP31]|uniref:alpha amylase C-terminal domain-containing protein n=1 Tax=Actinomadura sp. NTSP31 TaxID=1735447 RepID=UPI0035BF1D3D